MKLEQLQIFHNLTEDEMQKSLICSQAVVQKYQKMNIYSGRVTALKNFIFC